jgi:RHS repeat-associated protein
VERTGYNERLQVQSIQMGALGTPESVSGLRLFYCPGEALSCASNNGNVISQSISPLGATQTYGYDGVNRLVTAAEGTAWWQSNESGQWGNRWVSGQAGLPPDGETPISESAFDPWTNRINDGNYDDAGNRTVYGAYALAYDGENRLKTASRTVGEPITYEWEYDGEGRRVLMKTNGTPSTLFVYDATGQLAAEYGGPKDGGTWYLGVDHLGSTRLMVQEGTQGPDEVRRYDYLPDGPELLAGDRTVELGYGLAGPRLRFTGRERDVETGLDFFGARYFSGAQGRFTSPDPVIVTPARMQDPQRFNLYAYARNNPFKFIDPRGEDIEFANDTEDGRRRALALITRNLSAREAANIGIRQNKSGAYEAYVIDKKAIGKGASDAYKQLTGLIGDHSIVADVGVIGGGLTATFREGALGGLGPISSWSQYDSVFEPNPGSKHVNVLVTQGDLPGGSQVWCCNGKAVYQGVQPDFVTMWHELIGETLKYRAGHQNLRNNPALDSRTVIKIENEIRAVHGMNPRTGADHGETIITVHGKVQ